jgi:small subunit ribosomal protein S18
MAQMTRKPNKERSEAPRDSEGAKTKRVCAFCTSKTLPIYTDSVSLKRFLSSRGKIVPKQRSGVCSKHQRSLTKEIKHARFLALIPFTQKL